jgi:hypothetical protein
VNTLAIVPAWPASVPRGPFELANGEACRRWRDAKRTAYPYRFDELVVEVRDPHPLTAAEQAEIPRCCPRANMAIYVGRS